MQVILIFLLMLVGFILGTALNFLADSLPLRRSIFKAPICIKCGQTFHYSNYILFKRCNECNKKPSYRRIFVILISIAVPLLLYFFPPQYTGTWPTIVIFAYFGLVFIIDFEHRLVLHSVSIAGAILFVPLGIILNGWFKTLIGAAAGFGMMYFLYLLGILFGKWMSKRRGEEIEEVALGFGDVTLSCLTGCLIGWPRIGLVLLLAIILGGLFSLLFLTVNVLVKKYKAFTAIPYAPFIILATMVIIYISSKSV